MIEISTEVPKKIDEGLGEAAMLWNNEIGESDYTITNQEEYKNGAELLFQTKQMAKVISDEFGPQKSLADKAHKAICTSEKKYLKPLLTAEKTIKSRMSGWKEYQDEEDRNNEALVSSVLELDFIETRDKWFCEVVDPLKVPREFLIVDEKHLNDLARRTKGSVEVDGVRFNSTTTIVVRSKNEPINR